jgi:hypothetical protein
MEYISLSNNNISSVSENLNTELPGNMEDLHSSQTMRLKIFILPEKEEPAVSNCCYRQK